ncbi:MAG TPA: hypothetical protein VH268_10675 [Solirubrobacterales bacterium]|nr:hypothetical protein [Solirubrobacterales bacterium]
MTFAPSDAQAEFRANVSASLQPFITVPPIGPTPTPTAGPPTAGPSAPTAQCVVPRLDE